MSKRNKRPWLNIFLGLLCVGAIVIGYTTVGQASPSTTQSRRTATVANGVVQSTVSGTGNLQAASQLNLGFKTSGTVTHVYVTQGQHVTEGQLIATLNPQSAEVTLEQSKASLQSAEAKLVKEEETEGESSSESNTPTASAASTMAANGDQATVKDPTPTTSISPTSTSTTPISTGTTPTSTAPTTTSTTTSPTSTAPSKSTTTSTNSKETEAKKEQSKEANRETVSTATREANLASAKAAVKSDKLTVQSDEQAVQNTKLYAPEDGTIVSLSGQVGEVVSGNGTTKASGSSSSSSSGSASAGGGGSSGAGGAGASASTGKSSESSSSSSSAFAVLSDLSSMQLVAALSESEIGSVKDGQIATVTVEALEGRKLAAHVADVAILSTSSSGAVSYDVTFQLDQMTSGLKPGMSATAEVVVKQAEGINVPTSAITAGSVTVERGGKDVSQAVTAGLAGNSSTIILSGLKAGETVLLPATSSTGSSGASLTSKLGGRTGGGLGGGGGFPGGGGGFPAGGPPGG